MARRCSGQLVLLLLAVSITASFAWDDAEAVAAPAPVNATSYPPPDLLAPPEPEGENGTCFKAFKAWAILNGYTRLFKSMRDTNVTLLLDFAGTPVTILAPSDAALSAVLDIKEGGPDIYEETMLMEYHLLKGLQPSIEFDSSLEYDTLVSNLTGPSCGDKLTLDTIPGQLPYPTTILVESFGTIARLTIPDVVICPGVILHAIDAVLSPCCYEASEIFDGTTFSPRVVKKLASTDLNTINSNIANLAGSGNAWRTIFMPAAAPTYKIANYAEGTAVNSDLPNTLATIAKHHFSSDELNFLLLSQSPSRSLDLRTLLGRLLLNSETCSKIVQVQLVNPGSGPTPTPPAASAALGQFDFSADAVKLPPQPALPFFSAFSTFNAESNRDQQANITAVYQTCMKTKIVVIANVLTPCHPGELKPTTSPIPPAPPTPGGLAYPPPDDGFNITYAPPSNRTTFNFPPRGSGASQAGALVLMSTMLAATLCAALLV